MKLFHTLSIVCLIGMILCLFITIILYFKLNIQSTIGFLTGRSEKREIKAIKEAGVKDRNQHRHMMMEEKTAVLYLEKPDFYIEREIMFIHTEEVL